MRLSAGENRILVPVAPPPDQPSRESYQIFHDVLAGAVLEWRNRYTSAAERAEAEARAEEQRQRAEHEAQAATRLRKQRRLLFALLSVTGVLLFAVLVLSFFAQQQRRRLQATALELKALQEEFFAADARVKDLQEKAKVAQATAIVRIRGSPEAFPASRCAGPRG